MTDLYCGICGGRFEPDGDHVRVDAEKVRIHDRNTAESYVLHFGCWNSLTEGWNRPV